MVREMLVWSKFHDGRLANACACGRAAMNPLRPGRDEPPAAGPR